MSHQVARRYAKAVFEVGKDSGQLEALRDDFKVIIGLIDASSDLNDFLQNPALSLSKRNDLISKLFKKHAHATCYKFICFLSAKNRLANLKDICVAFDHMYLAELGIAPVTISSSVKLNSNQIHEISKHLQIKSGKDIEAKAAVEPGLIGGMKIREGNTIFDYSFKAQLDRFRKNIRNA